LRPNWCAERERSDHRHAGQEMFHVDPPPWKLKRRFNAWAAIIILQNAP
jgi:hypothetical protein